MRAHALRREGMTVDIALDGDTALEHAAVNRYDVVVLDRDLPGTHGDDVCRALAAGRSETRVLMLTAARSVADRVQGLGLSIVRAIATAHGAVVRARALPTGGLAVNVTFIKQDEAKRRILDATKPNEAPARQQPGRRVRVTGDLFHGRVPDGAVYVGRGAPGLPQSKFVNPFKRATREEAVSAYREWIAGQPALIAAARSELARRDLACWCPPGEPCHADVLLELASTPGAPADDAPAQSLAFLAWLAGKREVENGSVHLRA